MLDRIIEIEKQNIRAVFPEASYDKVCLLAETNAREIHALRYEVAKEVVQEVIDDLTSVVGGERIIAEDIMHNLSTQGEE